LGLIKIILNNKKTSLKILFIVAIILFLLFSDNGILDRIELANRKARSLDVFYNKIKENDSLTKYYFKILYDSTEIERIARIKYGMIKPDEELFLIEEEK
jgi:cell division protein FtsB